MPPLPTHPAYRIWIKDFLKALFDLSFQENVTVKMLPLLFWIGIATAAMSSVYLIANAFMRSMGEGLAYLMISPLFFIFAVAAIRSTLEFFSAVFSLQMQMTLVNQAMQGMNQKIESMQSNTQVMADSMDDFKDLTGRIPFFKKTNKPNKSKYWAESPLDAQFNFNDLSNNSDNKNT